MLKINVCFAFGYKMWQTSIDINIYPKITFFTVYSTIQENKLQTRNDAFSKEQDTETWRQLSKFSDLWKLPKIIVP